jgi:prepilin-type N-terminal cleavage/methylation domain-containing protein/prepilin-type processing-associated H-X9-DG protein
MVGCRWSQRSASRGFTLIELLVVVAITGVLVGLLLPAIQRIREAANRSSCGNNLRQMALACLNYEITHHCLPSGSKGQINADGTFSGIWADPLNGDQFPWGHFGWPALILPFVEQDDLYKTINFDTNAFALSVPESLAVDRGPAGDPSNQFASTHMPNVFVCPSAVRVKPSNEFKDYGINFGTGRAAPERSQQGMDGVAYVNSRVRLSEITDGTSNTLLLLEFAHFSSHGTVPAGVGTNQFFWVDLDSQGYVSCAEADGTPSPPNATTWSHRGAYSAHPGGVQSVMVDGHVAWIPNSIDFRVYLALFTRAGGEVIPGDF